jgi:hypothetical protein
MPSPVTTALASCTIKPSRPRGVYEWKEGRYVLKQNLEPVDLDCGVDEGS